MLPGTVPDECAFMTLMPGTEEGPVGKRGGATMRVAQVSMETRAPVTPGSTGGNGGALSLGMPRGLTPPAEAGGDDPRYYRRC